MSSKQSPRKGHSTELKVGLTPCSVKSPRERGSSRSSKPTSPIDADAVDQVMSINRHLLAQIDTLRLKIDIDDRHHAQSMSALQSANDGKIKTRELEIENLKSDIGKKELTIKNHAQTNKEKQAEIVTLQNHIDVLKDDVKISKDYAEEIQNHINSLQLEKSKLVTGDAYSEKDNEIQRLQNEVDNLRKNLSDLDRELSQAKKIISKQGGRLRQTDLERTNVQIKFKEELAKLSLNMRREVEKMRDVMKMQWNEMKALREQNEGMRGDLREIRELLVSDIHQNSHRTRSSSPVNLRPAPLSLPGVSRENTKMLQNRKKR